MTSSNSETITYLEAIRRTLWQEMERDDEVFILGEDVAEYGGAFKVTAGFLERFGASRVLDTPISEAAIVGAAIGASFYGKRPIVEMQFIDFISNAFNQIVNFAGKHHYRTGTAVPIVVRGPTGGTVRAGPFHSQSVESFFLNAPGLKVLVPATVEDAAGLLRAAIQDPNPVLFLEQKSLYRRLKGPAPALDCVTPIGKARVARAGSDATLISWGAMVHRCLDAAKVLAEREGVDVEVLDLRSLAPLDEEAIFASIKRTNRALIVHEAPQTGGFGGEIAARIAQGVFEWLDAPLTRLGARDVPIPYAAALEDAAIPTSDDIAAAALKLTRY